MASNKIHAQSRHKKNGDFNYQGSDRWCLFIWRSCYFIGWFYIEIITKKNNLKFNARHFWRRSKNNVKLRKSKNKI